MGRSKIRRKANWGPIRVGRGRQTLKSPFSPPGMEGNRGGGSRSAVHYNVDREVLDANFSSAGDIQCWYMLWQPSE